jgi:hypothetical protein
MPNCLTSVYKKVFAYFIDDGTPNYILDPDKTSYGQKVTGGKEVRCTGYKTVPCGTSFGSDILFPCTV